MVKKKLKILFLGAGKLLTLLEHFVNSSKRSSIDLELFSCESSRYCPIGKIAQIVETPRFEHPSFSDCLLNFVQTTKIDIVIPTMDSATVVLSSLKTNLQTLGAHALVSDYNLCKTMQDKLLSDSWFKAQHIDHIQNTKKLFPKIAKPSLGYASKGITKIYTQSDLNSFLQKNSSEFLVQDFIEAEEYTVDAYVDKNGKIIDIFTRARLEIEAGIVNKSLSKRNQEIINATKNILSIQGWYGPITLQFFYSEGKATIIEINPRFGGGVTHSLHCGLDIPSWIFKDYFDKPIDHAKNTWKEGVLMTRCRRDIFYDNCN